MSNHVMSYTSVVLAYISISTTNLKLEISSPFDRLFVGLIPRDFVLICQSFTNLPYEDGSLQQLISMSDNTPLN